MWTPFYGPDRRLYYENELGQRYYPSFEGDVPPQGWNPPPSLKSASEPANPKTTEDDRVRIITKLSLLWDQNPDETLRTIISRASARCNFDPVNGTANDKAMEQAIDDLLVGKKPPPPEPKKQNPVEDALQEYLYDYGRNHLARRYNRIEEDYRARYHNPLVDRNDMFAPDYTAERLRREGEEIRERLRREGEQARQEARAREARLAEQERIRAERAAHARRYWDHPMVGEPKTEPAPRPRNTEPLRFDPGSWTGRK